MRKKLDKILQMQIQFKAHLDEVIDYISDPDYERILSFFNYSKKISGQHLISKGDAVKLEYWVIKGSIKTVIHDNNQIEHIIQTTKQNSWITDYAAFFSKRPAIADLICLEDCEFLTISLKNRLLLCEEFHRMEHFWHQKTIDQNLILQDRLAGVIAGVDI